MDIQELIVPHWYFRAKQQGTPKHQLIKMVETYCLEAIKRRAQREGAPVPDHIEPEVVSITFNMYESAFQDKKK